MKVGCIELCRGAVWTLLLWLFPLVGSESSSCVQLLPPGQVGGGNYTYYRLAHEGNVQLILYTLSGDADIYVSQSTLQPTYELDSYDLNAASCGVDEVLIPSAFKRPVGIGIFGNPSHAVSSYELCVNLLPEYGDGVDEYDNSYYDEESENSGKPKPHVPRFNYEKDEEEESLVWDILIGLLKVIVEVFM